MPRTKLILICQSGGEFKTNDDGCLSYVGGEAHAVDVSHETLFNDLKLKLAEMCNMEYASLSTKYFIPGNRRTLITLSSDKDLKRMFDFYGDSITADIFISGKEGFNRESTPARRASGIKAAARVSPAAASQNVVTSDVTFRSVVAPIRVTPIVSSAAAAYGSGPASLHDTVACAASGKSPGKLAINSKHSALLDTTKDQDAGAKNNGTTEFDMSATPADTVKKRRRTASRKIGANAPTIVSDAVDSGEMKKGTSRRKNTWNCDADSTIVDVYVEQQVELPAFTPGSDMPYHLPIDINSDIVSVEKKVASWKHGIIGVGQDFKNVAEFRDVLQKYSIACRFGYRYKKNDTNRVSVRCAVEGCSWKIHASWVPSEQVIRIKKMNNSHTCGGESWKAAHPSKSWLVSIIKDRLRDSPHHKPKDIANGIYKDFGIELNYTQVWRGLEDARLQLQGSHKGAYGQLRWFCDALVEANPGSFTKLDIDDENKFQRFFVSFHASIHGFQNGCRPLLFLDSTSLKSKYHEVLLTATGIDGKDEFFPVAFAVVDIENDSNWHWFLEQLKSAVSTSRSITFVSDKDKELRKSVLEVFENGHHGYSLFHLLDSFMFNLKGPFNGDGKGTLLGHLLSAAHAVRPKGFRMFMEQIKRVSLNAYDWLMQSEPEYWANALFKGEHYDRVTVDVAELYAEWIEEVRERPIIQKVETLTCKIMELIYKRQIDSSGWTARLTPSKEKKMQEDTQKALHLKVLFSSDTIFEVHDDHVHVVNTENCNCTCHEWKASGLPCRHAIAVFSSVGKSPYDFCSKYFTVDSYRATYSGSITPVLAPLKPSNEGEDASDAADVLPPSTPRPPPQKEKKHKVGEFRRTVTCTRCKGVGHNKVTCKEPLASPEGETAQGMVDLAYSDSHLVQGSGA